MPPKSHSGFLVRVLPERLPGAEPRCGTPSLGSPARCPQRAGRPTVTPKANPRAWTLLEGELKDLSVDWSESRDRVFPWGPGWGSARRPQGGEAQACERGQGGVGVLASDVWRLRLEFVGIVISYPVKLDSHTGSASSWISVPLATGVSVPQTSPLSLHWKAAPDCPAPQAGRAT